jgi:hypothetical protein
VPALGQFDTTWYRSIWENRGLSVMSFVVEKIGLTNASSVYNILFYGFIIPESFKTCLK